MTGIQLLAFLSKTQVILNRFGFENPLIEPVNGGEENSTYKVILAEAQYVLRVYSQDHSTCGLRSRDQIQQELNFIKHLADRGVPTPRPIKAIDGDSVLKGPDSRFTVLFEFVDGEHLQAYDEGLGQEVGRLLRDIRNASTTFAESSTRQWPGDSPADYLEAYRSISSQFTQQQQKLLNRVAQIVEASLEKLNQLKRGYIHGDVKLGNLLFTTDGKLAAVIDFDDFRQGFYLEELARTLMHDLHDSKMNIIRSGFAPAMLEAYSLSEEESVLLTPILQARFLYDLGSYRYNNLTELVEELLGDQNITSFILE